MSQRKAVTRKKALTYRNANRADKSRILTELVELTLWHCDHTRVALREAVRIKIVKTRLGRIPTYGPNLLPGLVKFWSVLQASVRKTPDLDAPGFGADAAVRIKNLI